MTASLQRHVDTSKARAWASTDDQRRRWASALASPTPSVVASAMYDIGEARERKLAPDVLDAARRLDDPWVMRQAVWAIGKLGYTPGSEYVISATHASDYGIRKGAFWALGELGTSEAEARLHDVDGRLDGELAQIVGGALKKIRGEPVRASAAKVMKRVKRPVASDAHIQELIVRLDSDGLTNDETVALREQILDYDEDLFRSYMDYVREKQNVSKILQSGRVF